MNQARTTYQSDFTPFDWLRNNVTRDMDDGFCSSNNVDECLKYISQEFSALGFPAIYSNSGDSPSPFNCDIVKFLNITYELLRSNNEYIQRNEDLESRNERLCADLNSLSKKNSLLKNTLEQNERKHLSALERERQLKEKNEQLLQKLKAEKEEAKKLSVQHRQQKSAYQHEIRKYENNMSLIKAKINQLLSDKNPNKKIATITSYQPLPRNSGQRGKWKTGVATTTAVEEMYASVISEYEAHKKELCTKLNSFHQLIQSIISEVVEIVSALQVDCDKNIVPKIIEEFPLNQIKNNWDISNFEAAIKYLLGLLKESALLKIHAAKENLENQTADVKANLSTDEKSLEDSNYSQRALNICNTCDLNTVGKKKGNVKLTEEVIELEKKKIEEEKLALSKALEDIEKEKAEVAVQKVALFKLAIQQRTPSSSWHESLSTFPSISVLTSGNESYNISSLNYLKSPLNTPEQISQSGKSFSPQWTLSEFGNDITLSTKSDTNLPSKSFSISQSPAESPLLPEIKFSDSDLPSWVSDRTESPSSFSENVSCTTLEISHESSNELLCESSNEEINMLRLRAAVEDIEKRRNTP